MKSIPILMRLIAITKIITIAVELMINNKLVKTKYILIAFK